MNDPETMAPKPPKNPTPEEMFRICKQCHGTCCTYVAIEIDCPTTLEDFENIRWYCAHQKVWVFKDAGSWYVAFDAVCEKLQSDFSCGIYPNRPKVCRDHKFGECDYYLRGAFEVELRSLDEVDAYLRKRFPSHFRKKRLADRQQVKAEAAG
jgi:Fe-S-cluster containining protein